MKCYRIYARFVNKVWSQVVDILDKALAYNNGTVTSSQLYKQLVSGTQSLWIGADDDGVIQCAGTTEVVDYPNKKVMRIITFATKSGRDLELWFPLLEEVKKHARQMKCASLEAWVRKGLAKRLDWDHEHVVIIKQLET